MYTSAAKILFLIIKLKDYSIGFSSDTKVFEGFTEQFNGTDILVLNLLRPNSVKCKRHMCTDEVIPYLNNIFPNLKGLIITHFGSYMDSLYSSKNYVHSQVKKLIEMTNIKSVIGAEDGMKIKIDKILVKNFKKKKDLILNLKLIKPMPIFESRRFKSIISKSRFHHWTNY